VCTDKVWCVELPPDGAPVFWVVVVAAELEDVLGPQRHQGRPEGERELSRGASDGEEILQRRVAAFDIDRRGQAAELIQSGALR